MPRGASVPDCLLAHLATLVEVGGGKIATGRGGVLKGISWRGAKMSYSSICLIFKLKVGRAQCSLCVKDGPPQTEQDRRDHSSSFQPGGTENSGN